MEFFVSQPGSIPWIRVNIYVRPDNTALKNLYISFSERSFVNKNVKARLLSIDSKGVHTIELKKSEDGPFGFYISTGTYRNKKGW